MATAPLYCTHCHTRWIEAVLREWGPCPYRDCPGLLATTPPGGVVAMKPTKRPAPTFPLLDAAGLTAAKPKGHAR